MIIPMLCVTIFVILVVWFLLPRVARLMIHTPTAISIFVCLSMVQLMAVFISMRSEERFSRNAETDLVCRLLLEKKNAALSPPMLLTPSRTFCLSRLSLFMTRSQTGSTFFPYTTLFRSRDYFRDIGRMVLAAEGRKANDSHADCYQYFCVPEYGTANGRLHFHAVHFMRTLPTGSVDPNFGRRVRNRRQLNSLQNTWP